MALTLEEKRGRGLNSTGLQGGLETWGSLLQGDWGLSGLSPEGRPQGDDPTMQVRGEVRKLVP